MRKARRARADVNAGRRTFIVDEAITPTPLRIPHHLIAMLPTSMVYNNRSRTVTLNSGQTYLVDISVYKYMKSVVPQWITETKFQ